MNRIVVGVGDFTEDHPAIAWAIQFARRSRAGIDLVHVVDTSWGHVPEEPLERALLVAEEALRDTARRAESETPGVTVTSHARIGSPVNELVGASEGADLLVVSAHPRTRDSGASRRISRITALARCSVVVVPSEVIPRGEGVVVGVDGSVASDVAVQFAAELADAHNESLTVVLAWGEPEAWSITEPLLVEREPAQEDLLMIAESIAGLAERFPDLTVVSEVSASHPEHALFQLSRDARMLVVGSHGRRGLAHALLGSVSESMIAELPCAVAVIRAVAAPRE